MKKLGISIILFYFILSIPMAQNYNGSSLGNLASCSQDGQKFLLSTGNGKAEVTVMSPTIIRIRICKTEFTEDFSYTVIGRMQECRTEFANSGKELRISTDSVLLLISKDPVRFTFLTKDNRVINEDDPAFGTMWVGEEVATFKRLQPGEHFLGLGEKTGNLDRRGESHTNWNTDNFAYRVTDDEIYSSFPFYIGVHNDLSYGIYFDNTHKAYFNFAASNDRFSSFGADAGEMDYYFIYRNNLPKIIEDYTWLTGRMHLPPLWALGFQQCRWSYFPDTEVINTVKTFREKKIPIDVIYLDIHYMDAYKVFTWHPERFAKPEATIRQLGEMGVKTAVIIDPGVKVEEGYAAHEDGVAKDVFIKYPDGQNYTAQVWPGWCHFPDFTNPSARAWWGGWFSSLVNAGVEGFWNDMNEIASWGEGATPMIVKLDWEGQGASYKQGKNIYGMQMSRSTYEGVRGLMKGRRPLVLTRAAFSGAQRYTAIWTGDNVASEEHMMLGVRLVNSLGISGMAFSGVDVGGFSGEAAPALFGRWITIGTFTPFFRVHKAYNEKVSEPWSYGEDIESIARNYISLRYRLLPYIYSVFYEASSTGMPINRALVLENTNDENCWKQEFQHEYMFGPSLLVAPLESTQRTAKVYLPEGIWYDFFTGRQYEGGREIYTDSPLDKLPVFAKGGSVIPMQGIVQSTSMMPSDTLFLHVYNAPEGSEFLFYEDDGSTYDYENGKSGTRKIEFDPQSRLLKIGKIEGEYSSGLSNVCLMLHGFEGVTDVIRVGGVSKDLENVSVDLITALDENDPLYLGGKKYPQPVKKCVFGMDKDKDTLIAW